MFACGSIILDSFFHVEITIGFGLQWLQGAAYLGDKALVIMYLAWSINHLQSELNSWLASIHNLQRHPEFNLKRKPWNC